MTYHITPYECVKNLIIKYLVDTNLIIHWVWGESAAFCHSHLPQMKDYVVDIFFSFSNNTPVSGDTVASEPGGGGQLPPPPLFLTDGKSQLASQKKIVLDFYRFICLLCHKICWKKSLENDNIKSEIFHLSSLWQRLYPLKWSTRIAGFSAISPSILSRFSWNYDVPL